MCDNWHGLIIGDYQTVMPVPWRRKLGFRYGYVPAFIQQLGLVGDTKKMIFPDLMKEVYSFLSLADLHFNFSNTIIQDSLPVLSRPNLVLQLADAYQSIYAGYRNDLKENIRKAEAENLIYADGSINEAISLYQKLYSSRIEQVKQFDYLRFRLLCESLQNNHQCFVRKAADINGNTLATGLFLKDSKRVYNIMNTTLPAGRAKEANHFLLNKVIKEFCGQDLLFDFEGSALPGVKHFYDSFGAVDQPYFYYHFNGLPWLLRSFKR